jgi:predicted dehydrogenase
MKILILGCGRIFSKHLDSIKKIKKYSLVGICDINRKKVLDLSKKLKVPGFVNFNKSIRETMPDIVSILTPSGLHAEHIIEALNNNLNVIVEKPMCLKVSDGEKIISLAKRVNKRVFVVMQNKFNLSVVKFRKDLKKKKFGRIFHGSVIVRWHRDISYYNQANWRGTWKFDGGVISNQASHHIDLLRTIMGDPISVYAKSFNHLVRIEAEDTALIIVKFKNNKSAVMELTTAARPNDIEGSISIMGSDGSAKIGGFALNKISYYNFGKKKLFRKKIFNTEPNNVYGYGHLKFYEHVHNSLKLNLKSEFECFHAIQTVKFINAIYKSIENKKEIFFNKNIVSAKLGVYEK